MNEDLHRYIYTSGPMPEYEAKVLYFQLFEAVEALGRRNVIHRDLSPSNIMYDEKFKYPFIIDFGGGVRAKPTDRITVGPSPANLTMPEVRGKNFSGSCYGNVLNTYQLGAIMYFVLTGSLPAETTSINDYPLEISFLTREFIQKCISANAKTRQRFKYIRTTPFFYECDKTFFDYLNRVVPDL